MAAKAAITLVDPLYTQTAHRLDVSIFSDNYKTPSATTMTTVTVLIKDTGATLRTYTCTAVSNAQGTGYITLNQTYHTVAGDADVWVRIGGIPKERYTIPFLNKPA